MKIAIYGVDDLGQALGFRFSENGHTVTFTGEDVDNADFQKHMEKASTFGAISAPMQEAVHQCQYLVFTNPLEKAQKICQSVQTFEQKIIIDCTSPREGPPYSKREGKPVSSLKSCSTGGRFVKAFHTMGPSVFADSRFQSGPKPACFLCGEDTEALEKVSILCDDLGLEPVVVGDLDWASHLDSLALLWDRLSQSDRIGEDFAWAILRRER